MSVHSGDPFCGDDPHYAIAYGLPENPFDPSPLLSTCPPMPTGALGTGLQVQPTSVGEAATLLQTAGQDLHRVADSSGTALANAVPRLGVMARPLQQGFDEAVAAVRDLADDVSRLSQALTDVLRAYAELDGDPLAAGRAV